MNDPLTDSRESGTTRRALFGGLAGLSAAGMLGRSALGQETPVPATPASVSWDAVARPGFPAIELTLRTDLPSITDEQLWYVASVVNAQVTLDFGPIWGVDAWVTAAQKKKKIPTDAWEITIYDTIKTDAVNGIENSGHAWKDPNDCTVRPFGFVVYDDINFLAHAVSHECLEMLANPYMSQFHMLPTIDPNGKGDVLYPQEICDPCSTANDGYTIDGVLVSDFVTPRYYDRKASTGVNYSLRGNIDTPLGITMGSNLNWLAADITTWWKADQKPDGLAVSTSNANVVTNCTD